MKIARFDDYDITNTPAERGDAYETYIDNDDNYSLVKFKDKQKPNNGWAMPYVTGHRYRVHWERGLDFDQMDFEVSERW